MFIIIFTHVKFILIYLFLGLVSSCHVISILAFILYFLYLISLHISMQLMLPLQIASVGPVNARKAIRFYGCFMFCCLPLTPRF